MDETTLQVMGEQGRTNTSNSYIWLRIYEGRDPPAVSYRYYLSRATYAAQELLAGFSGMIQTDAYGVYQSLVKARDGELKQAFCLTHARRKFYDIYVSCGGKSKKRRKKNRSGDRYTPESHQSDLRRYLANLYLAIRTQRTAVCTEDHRRGISR